jgi:hypothetical protein
MSFCARGLFHPGGVEGPGTDQIIESDLVNYHTA